MDQHFLKQLIILCEFQIAHKARTLIKVFDQIFALQERIQCFFL